jgi:hypothetical protein
VAFCLIVALSARGAQTLTGPGRFLVKLGTDLGSKKSKVGGRVTAFVISPERYLGASFEGVVDQVADGSLRFTFQTLRSRTVTTKVTSIILDFVNSKGHELVDEQERPVQIVNGLLTSKSADFTIDEGAEFSLRITPVK